MAKIQQQRHSFQCQLFFFLVVLCVSASLRFNAAAQEKLPPKTEAKIRAVLNSPQLKGAHVGLSILDLGTVKDAQSFPAKAPIGKPFRVLFESDAGKKFMPASNMKLFTAAIALELLGKEKTFPTYVKALESREGEVLKSSVYFQGGGDPSLKIEDLENLAKQFKALGIKNISGGIVGDGNLFTAETFGGRYPFGWTIDDAIWYYAPEISALAINRNQIDVTLAGGLEGADRFARIYFRPHLRGFNIVTSVITGSPQLASKSSEELLHWNRFDSFYNNPYAVLVTGQIAPKQEITEGIAVPRPNLVAAATFQWYLKEAGVEVKQEAIEGKAVGVTLLQHDSPPLGVLFQRFLKNSDNLYAEMLLRDAAYYHDGTGGDKAGPRAHALLKKWLIAQGIDTSNLRFEDGSGLSRYNLLTPRATAELLAAINRMKDGDVIWDALPIAGTDGTMKKRLTSTPARRNLATGNVRAKSGTFSIASNLSGYVTTKNNRRLAVAIYINFPRDTDSAQAAQDKICAILANSQM